MILLKRVWWLFAAAFDQLIAYWWEGLLIDWFWWDQGLGRLTILVHPKSIGIATLFNHLKWEYVSGIQKRNIDNNVFTLGPGGLGLKRFNANHSKGVMGNHQFVSNSHSFSGRTPNSMVNGSLKSSVSRSCSGVQRRRRPGMDPLEVGASSLWSCRTGLYLIYHI